MEYIKRNKEISILFVIILYLYLVLAFGGCGRVDKKISLIGELNEEETFGYYVKNGVEKASEKLGAKVNYLDISLDEDWEVKNKEIRKYVAKSGLSIFIGEEYKNLVQILSKENRFKNFLIIDAVLEEPNVKSITYKNEEGSFLMGIIAGNETKTNKVGFIGGVDDNFSMKFLSGFASGVKVVNKKASEEIINRNNVRFLEENNDGEKSYKDSIHLYDSGCDIIFCSVDKGRYGVFKAAKEKGKKVITIDTNLEELSNSYKGVVISSIIKNVDYNLYDLLKNYLNGSFKSGKENNIQLGVKDGSVDYSPLTYKFISNETFEMIEEYKEKIIENKIKIPQKLFEVIQFKI